MAKPPNCPPILLLSSSLLIIINLFFPNQISANPNPNPNLKFTPTDNHLINCGSSSPATTTDNRNFLPDESFLSSTRSNSLHDSADPRSPLYSSARVFIRPSAYLFHIKDKGPHLVRLHFRKFHSYSTKFDLQDAQFHVLAGGYLLLNAFDATKMENLEIKEYILWVDSDKLEIEFVPLRKSKFGFVNAIEVVSAPKDLVPDIARKVDSNGAVRIDGLSKLGFENLFRVNVGGPKVTPFNDSLWRTWVTDDGFLSNNPNGESKEVHFSGRIKYRLGGASREVAPDHVYDSARVVVGTKANARYNLTWEFRVVSGFKYLVRTHFCDIVSPVLGSLYFNVYVNGNLAYENLDLSMLTTRLASPFYADFVVDDGGAGVITVSVGPSADSSVGSGGFDGILNGVEVFKMSNSMRSFDGMVSGEAVLKKCRGGSGGVLVPLAAAMGLLVAASVILKRRFMGIRDSVPWSRLPTDVSEVNLKSGY